MGMAGDELFRRWPTDRPSSGLSPRPWQQTGLLVSNDALISRTRMRLLPPLGRGTRFRTCGQRPALALGRAGTCAAGRATPSPAPAATEVSFTASDVRRSARNREAAAAASTGSGRGRAPCRPGPCRRSSESCLVGVRWVAADDHHAPSGIEPASGVVVYVLAPHDPILSPAADTRPKGRSAIEEVEGRRAADVPQEEQHGPIRTDTHVASEQGFRPIGSSSVRA
jgi:hypothetical protein